MKKLDRNSIANELSRDVAKAQRYSVFAFVIFVILIYGFVLLRFNSLRNTDPKSDDGAEHFDRLQMMLRYHQH